MRQNDVNKIIKLLIKEFGKNIPIYLNYHKNKPYEFLFAVILSCQCKDERVNKVTKVLFDKYRSLKEFACANLKILENDIKSLGFYRNKSKNLILTSNILLDKFGGKVQNDFNELLKLPGVGRKTASVVIGQLFNTPAMAVDTHVARVSTRIFGLKCKNVREIEEKLKKIVPIKYWNLWNTHIIAIGRMFCYSRKQKCEICPIRTLCIYNNKTNFNNSINL